MVEGRMMEGEGGGGMRVRETGCKGKSVEGEGGGGGEEG